MPDQAIVTRSYQTPYDDPLKLKAGEIVAVGEKEAEWPGWVWVTDSTGRSGWAPVSIIEISHGRGCLRTDYDATELNVGEGERLEIINTEAGWGWCRTGDGRTGWVPLEHMDKLKPEGRKMKYGARNQLHGKVVEIKKGGLMCKVRLEIPAASIMNSVMTIESLEDLNLAEGDTVKAVVKAINVLLVKE